MFGVQGLHTLPAGACGGHVLRKPQQEAQVTSSEVYQHLPQAMGPLKPTYLSLQEGKVSYSPPSSLMPLLF